MEESKSAGEPLLRGAEATAVEEQAGSPHANDGQDGGFRGDGLNLGISGGTARADADQAVAINAGNRGGIGADPESQERKGTIAIDKKTLVGEEVWAFPSGVRPDLGPARRGVPRIAGVSKSFTGRKEP